MRLRPAAPLLLSLLLLPLAGGAVPGFDASAAGTADLIAYDGWTGSVACDTGAAFAFETSGAAGVLAWHAPECEAPSASGAVPFAFRCHDLCFSDCWLTSEEARCDGYTLDGAAVHATLARDGTFLFQWWAWDGSGVAEAQGTLLVTSWPS